MKITTSTLKIVVTPIYPPREGKTINLENRLSKVRQHQKDVKRYYQARRWK